MNIFKTLNKLNRQDQVAVILLRHKNFLLSLSTTIFGILIPSPSIALPSSYNDPSNYPAAWPAPTTWVPYTAGGSPIEDKIGSVDSSNGGATPNPSIIDIAGGPGIPSVYFYRDSSNLYVRFRLEATPVKTSGNSEPFDSATWTVLLDVDGDGFKEFAVQVSGSDSGGEPDDIIVFYDNSNSQSLNLGSNVLWRQDSAVGNNNTADGETGDSSTWDVNSNANIYDFKRTRVSPDGAGKYFLDIQVPLAALDASSKSGPTITASSPFALAYSTAASNTDPAQKDFAFSGDYVSAINKPLPFGDVVSPDGTTSSKPNIKSVTGGTCGANSSISAEVIDSLKLQNGNLVSSISQVQFLYYADLNGNGIADDGQSWVSIGNGTLASSTTNPWTIAWNTTGFVKGKYLLKAIATDDQGNIVDSSQTSTSNAQYNVATNGTTPIVYSLDNTCGVSKDYGDAPDTYGTDNAANNSSGDPVGASHIIAPGLFLGATVPDADANGFVDGTDNNSNATDDDAPTGTGTGNGDDEDNFTLPTLTTGDTSYAIPASSIKATNTTTQPATLHAWIDFNKNNKFDPTEYASVPVNQGTSGGNPIASLTWNGISVGTLGNTYARFRLTSDSSINNNTPGGTASNGEVEDYLISIATVPVPIYDYGDAPDRATGSSTGNYQTTASDGGAAQVVINTLGQVLSLGSNIDTDNGSLQDDSATADDNNGTSDDEDGVTSFPTLTTADAQTYVVPVSVKNNVPLSNAYLVGYIDFNKDGDFLDAGEKSTTVTVPTDTSNPRTFDVTFTTPAGMTTGNTYARFRLGQVRETAESATGASISTDSGEIEDYQIAIAPTPTVPTSNSSSCPSPAALISAPGFTLNSPNNYLLDSALQSSLPLSLYNGTLKFNATLSGNATWSEGVKLKNDASFGNHIFLQPANTDGYLTSANKATYEFSFPIAVKNFSMVVGGLNNYDGTTITASYQGNPVSISAANFSNLSTGMTLSDSNIDTDNQVDTVVSSNTTGEVEVTNNIYTLTIPDQIDKITVVGGKETSNNTNNSTIGFSLIGYCGNLDYGDAPDSYGTNSIDNNGEGVGARHLITSNLKLGANAPDAETDAQAPLDGTGDGTDEDAITTLANIPSVGNYNLTVPVTNTGSSATLHAWIDFNKNSKFEAGEYKATPVANGATSANLSWAVPSGLTPGNTYVRFRLTTTALTYNTTTTTQDERSIGLANDGEVEDYQIAIASPISPLAGQLVINEVLYAQTGTNSAAENDEFIEIFNPSGNTIDLSGFKLIDGNLLVSDTDDVGSITGNSSPYVFPNGTSLKPGEYAVIWVGNQISGRSATGAAFQAWLSTRPNLNNTGDDVWLYDANTKVIDYMVYGTGTGINIRPNSSLNLWNSTYEDKLDNPTPGQSISLTPNGIDGNSSACWEKTAILTSDPDSAGIVASKRCTNFLNTIDTDIAFVGTNERVTSVGKNNNQSIQDYGDAPAGYEENNSARHALTSSLHLGNVFPDAETAAQSTTNADGDDTVAAPNLDDEDNFTTLPTLTTGATSYTIPKGNIIATNGTGQPATLHAWIDFNKNGKFDSAEHKSVPVDSGTNAGNPTANLTWSGISVGAVGNTYARFRLTTDSSITNATPGGAANNGEVEDYQIAIAQASNPKLLLVKRITAINPGKSGEIIFNNFVDDSTSNDNNANWPDSDGSSNNNINDYLRGETIVPRVKPGDEVEYTIYFLSNGDEEAKNVNICDVVPDNMTFVANSYGANFGMALALNPTTLPTNTTKNLSNAIGDDIVTSNSAVVDGNTGVFYPPNTNPGVSNLCKKHDPNNPNTLVPVNSTNNLSGAVFVELSNPLPAATGSGTPPNSYGFIRFRAKVK